jgi:hypothetical protein
VPETITEQHEPLEVLRRHPGTERVFRRRFREVETWMTQGNSIRDCCIIEKISCEALLRELNETIRGGV